MDNIDFNIDLINFINQEKTEKKIGLKKCFKYFNNCLIKSIIELNNKFINIKNKNENIIGGINMIYYIYFLLISYSNNIKLTIFLLERAILLYSEFIIMSQDKKIIDEICFVPNITDAVSFAYKKTIGPLKIQNINKFKKENYYVKDISWIIKNIFQQKFLVSNKIDISKNLTEINIILETNLFNIFEKTHYDFHNILFDKLKDILIHYYNEYNINYSVYKIKIFIEIIYLYIENNKFNNEILEYIYNEILNNTLDNISDYSNYKNYKNSNIYKQLINF
jgi:hypothetical protein